MSNLRLRWLYNQAVTHAFHAATDGEFGNHAMAEEHLNQAIERLHEMRRLLRERNGETVEVELGVQPKSEVTT